MNYQNLTKMHPDAEIYALTTAQVCTHRDGEISMGEKCIGLLCKHKRHRYLVFAANKELAKQGIRLTNPIYIHDEIFYLREAIPFEFFEAFADIGDFSQEAVYSAMISCANDLVENKGSRICTEQESNPVADPGIKTIVPGRKCFLKHNPDAFQTCLEIGKMIFEIERVEGTYLDDELGTCANIYHRRLLAWSERVNCRYKHKEPVVIIPTLWHQREIMVALYYDFVSQKNWQSVDAHKITLDYPHYQITDKFDGTFRQLINYSPD